MCCPKFVAWRDDQLYTIIEYNKISYVSYETDPNQILINYLIFSLLCVCVCVNKINVQGKREWEREIGKFAQPTEILSLFWEICDTLWSDNVCFICISYKKEFNLVHVDKVILIPII